MLNTTNRWIACLLAAALAVGLCGGALETTIMAQEAAPAPAEAAAAPAEAPAEAAAEPESPPGTPDEGLTALMEEHGAAFDYFTVSNLWIMIAATFVFIMHLGFSTLESGLCQSKNVSNVLFKNVFILCMGPVVYALWGFNAMYPGDAWAIGKFFAMGSPIATYTGADLTFDYGGSALAMTKFTDFVFQAMFAATAATIVSGAVAERVKLGSFMIYAVVLVGFAYPITGSWQWGAGWLSDAGFKDFAGSSLVHGFGGFAALAAVIVLGPRKGKFLPDGRVKPILPHSTPLATIGTFLLFFGWFGFNGGSVLSAAPGAVSHVFATTLLGGCGGGLAAIIASKIFLGKPDLSMALNGILAGLVGITAGADTIGVLSAFIMGAVAGVIVILSVIFFDKIKIDDPVGAISVHGVCGIWGTIAVGIFSLDSEHKLGTQIMGTVAVCAFAFIASLIIALVVKMIFGLRVSAEEEANGLDVDEHGAPAYHFGSDASEIAG